MVFYLNLYHFVHDGQCNRLTMKKIKIGIIGLGRMGKKHLYELQKNSMWEVKYVCDTSESRREHALSLAPDAIFTTNEDDIFNDPEIDAVALCALADVRFSEIEKAIAHRKHVMAEKPLAYSLEDEWKAVSLTEGTGLVCVVNTYLKNAWYTNEMKEFIKSGEIGELAIVRICHMTPGLAPGEGHEYEGPSFHDCGMHYVDIARWFAESEFKTGHAQAVRMWQYKDPWWLQCHGTFENGVVFDITQGHVYGQLSKNQTHNSYMDIIGTKGIVRMHHDFKTAVVEKHGVTVTERIERPYGEKNIDRMYQVMGESILNGIHDPRLPNFRDATIASEFAWKMLADAATHDMPAIGTTEELEQIHRRRATMKNGYGLLR